MNCSACDKQLLKLEDCFGDFNHPLCNECFLKESTIQVPDPARINSMERRLGYAKEELEEKRNERDEIEDEISSLEYEIWDLQQKLDKYKPAPVTIIINPEQLQLFDMPSTQKFKG